MAPKRPKIYHITHVSNLAKIIDHGGLMSDSEMIARGGPEASIGMSGIKRRRLSLPVHPHPGTAVGDYVPFYFCPRSIMLFVIHCANHPELTYRGGQGPIVHLECDLHTVVERAEDDGQAWAFSTSSAGAYYTDFYSDLDDLDEINWAAVSANDFRDRTVKEMKQAEFLLHAMLSWNLVERIGVRSAAMLDTVQQTLTGSDHQPRVAITRKWYY